MAQLTVNLKKVKYQVGKQGLGGYIKGQIIDAYLIESDHESNVEFIYHPNDDLHELCPSIDVCEYDARLNCFCPVKDTESELEYWINLIETPLTNSKTDV